MHVCVLGIRENSHQECVHGDVLGSGYTMQSNLEHNDLQLSQ
jgi:hypothetical protein